MRKTLHIATREFASTVLTKGFILGVVMTPLLLLIAVGAFALLANQPSPKVEGTVAVIDRSGLVIDELVRSFTPEALAKEQEELARETSRLMTEQATRFGIDQGQVERAGQMTETAVRDSLAKSADLEIEVLAPDADPEKERAGLANVDVHARESDPHAAKPRVMVAVIPEGSVLPAEGAPGPDQVGADGGYHPFIVYAPQKLDFEIRRRVEAKIADAIVTARVAADPRLKSSNLSAATLRQVMRRPETDGRTVTRSGEETKSLGELQMLIPAGFMLLLMISVMTAGNYLLTTTIEEKGSRVMEVLLSAVSPMQLMTGKIVGQMCVGLLMLGLYSGLGIVSLLVFSKQYLVDPMNLVYLVLFFLIAFFIVASMMAAVGSAVTELREAQTLMTPIMVVMIIPWLLWFPISRAPNSTFATVLSFVPGPNPFVMIIRLAGSEPVPGWQTALSIAVGLATAVASAWFAAKVFRVGVLMYGKPPDLRTLVRWVRMA